MIHFALLLICYACDYFGIIVLVVWFNIDLFWVTLGKTDGMFIENIYILPSPYTGVSRGLIKLNESQ